MHSITLLIILFLIIAYIGSKALGIDWSKFSYAKRKGKAGEKSVASILKRLPKSDYTILNDLMLRTNRGTTQIDHVVVSRYGIFVIETKNYQGIISGSEKSSNWTQNLYGNKYDMVNPVNQNYAHIAALKQILSDCESLPMYSIIVFPYDTTLYVKVENASVINSTYLLSTIRNFTDGKISEDKVEKIVQRLMDTNITDKTERQNHIKTTRLRILQKESDIANLICPRCGGKLMLQQGKYGEFYRCSNYPRCKFTCSIK